MRSCNMLITKELHCKSLHIDPRRGSEVLGSRLCLPESPGQKRIQITTAVLSICFCGKMKLRKEENSPRKMDKIV